ncbi:MAG: sodium:solute symporter family protein [Ignavibacteriales bacterium]
MINLTAWSWFFALLYIAALVYLSWLGNKRTKNLEDFTTAKQQYGWFIISFATVASWCSAAAFLGQPGMGYGIGFPALWYVMGYAMSGLCWCLSMFGVWKVGAKLGARTTPDFLGKRFQSDFIKGFAAIVTVMNIYYVAGQFVGLGWLFLTALKIPYLTGIIISAAITCAYIIVGGTHADLLTDAFQGALMAVASVLVLFACFLFVVPGGVAGINQAIVAQNPALGWDNVFSSVSPLFTAFPAISICIALGGGALSPQMSKNFLALKSKSDLPKVAIVAAGLMVMMSWMMLGGIGARAALGGDLAKTPDLALPTLLTKLLPAPVTAFMVVAMLAAIMSSADGLYLVIATAIASDLYKDIIAPRLGRNNSDQAMEKRVLMLNRLFIAIVTVVALKVAYPAPKYLTALIWTGLGGFTCSISPSILSGAFWRRCTPVASAVSMVASFATYAYCIFLKGLHPYTCCGIGLLISIPTIVIVSLFTKPQSKEFLDELFA